MKTILSQSDRSPGSRSGLRSWVGPTAATCGWTFVGKATASIGCGFSRKSWLICNPTCSSQVRPQATAALQRETRTIPIVFVFVSDPVGDGFVASVPRPGGNITGFSGYEASMAGKWLELLMEIAPGVNRVAALFNPDTAAYVRSYFLPSFQAAAGTIKVPSIIAAIHNDAEIETVIGSLGREPRGGLVVMPDSFEQDHRAVIISLAARNNVPAVYSNTVCVREGGLLSYATEFRGYASSRRHLCRSHSPWRKADGPAGSTAGQI